MKEKDKNFIKDWFLTDLNIEIKAGRKENNILIAENNASYYKGTRYRGDKRTLDAIMEFNDEDYERIKDVLGKEYSYEELIEALEEIEKRGLKIEVL